MKPPEEHIPSKYTIIPYYIIAAFAFVSVSVLCFIASGSFTGHYFQPKILAITHLAIFGWATMVIFGASNQLAPVICEKKLFSENLPIAIICMLSAGTALLVISFWNFTFNTLTYAGGILLLSATILHAYNIYKTARAGKEEIVRDFMLMAHIWLVITCVIGLMLLVNLRYPFLPASHLHYLKIHASIGMAGWFIQLIIGISSRLVPMFLLSRNEEKKFLTVSYYTLNTGLTFFLMEGVVFKTTWGRPLYLLLVLAGIISYLLYIRRCYKSAMRKQIDNGMKQTFVALVCMSFPFLLLLAVLYIKDDVAYNITTAYGFSFFAGFISTIIMGQTFKTLPFIVWMHITHPNALPEFLPKDLFKESWVKWQMFLYLPGFLSFLTGILVKQEVFIYAGATLMIIASAWYCLHVILIVNKLKR